MQETQWQIYHQREDAATRNLSSPGSWGRKRLSQKTSEEEDFISSTRQCFQSQPNQKQFKGADRERERERETARGEAPQ